MTCQTTTFDERFQAVFDAGVADIKFFVRPHTDITIEKLRDEVLGFQEAVDDGKIATVEGIDKDIPQVDFNSEW